MFRVFVGGESLERAGSGAIWGNVWLEFDGKSFPHWRWNDMVVPYLTALTEGVEDASAGGAARVMFFDGPFWVDIRAKAGALEVSPGGGGADLPSCIEETTSLAADVLAVGRLVVERCESEGWGDDDDVRALRSALRRLAEQCRSAAEN
ncbi:hypothetical protein ACH3WN_16055 [Streptomyces albogriseolus]|uniref:hypothetical protein n=1 Tax=Streptomyces albogriseolus TaxID=1887 RepID=UPI0037AA4BEB